MTNNSNSHRSSRRNDLVVRFAVVAAVMIFAVTTVEAADFKVVVNSANPTSSITKAEMSKIYLKRTTKWSSGAKIHMVDQKASSEARDAFFSDVLGRDSVWVSNHWQKIVFSGRGAPPQTMRSDADVLEFVRSQAGAVGFVDGETALGGGVKILQIVD